MTGETNAILIVFSSFLLHYDAFSADGFYVVYLFDSTDVVVFVTMWHGGAMVTV